MRNLNPRAVLGVTPLYILAVVPATYFSVRVMGDVWGSLFSFSANLILLILLVRGTSAED